MTRITNIDDAWDDALAVVAGLRKVGTVNVTTRPSTDDDTPRVITSDNEGRVVLVLQFQYDGWWMVTDAVGNAAEAFAHNTHPRVMAKAINRAHWNVLA